MISTLLYSTFWFQFPLNKKISYTYRLNIFSFIRNSTNLVSLKRWARTLSWQARFVAKCDSPSFSSRATAERILSPRCVSIATSPHTKLFSPLLPSLCPMWALFSLLNGNFNYYLGKLPSLSSTESFRFQFWDIILDRVLKVARDIMGFFGKLCLWNYHVIIFPVFFYVGAH